MILQSNPTDPAAWQLLAHHDCVLALPAVDAARFDGLGDLLGSPDAFRLVLEALVAGGIAAAPPFALLDGDDEVLRVVLRGDAVVVVTPSAGDAAPSTISGAGVATWSERVLEGARSLRLQVPGGSWTVELADASRPVPTTAPETVVPTPAAPAPVSAAPAPAAPAAAPAETTLVPRAELDAAALPAPLAEPETEAYDFLFGDTIYRTHAGTSVRIPNPDPTRPGDHDGQTMLADQLGLSGHVPEAPQPKPSLPLRPALQLERADGARESLAQPVVIGRAPSVSAAASPAPRLITIADDKDISRSHVRVAVEGDVVVVTDLASKNGTVITLPNAAPRTLRSGEPTVVLPGTLIDLGGGVTFTVRED